ncbi:S1 family peptidase [Oerskovia turbata]|uniref:S1 family peptidase n=1 Tax=Oerskovia turbata TaxID=1713 RepID=A0A4Q1KY83_9CELL|nr:S1 family peptidase [Oerskovia turbata]RXR25031.1 S1 family peptidase [Oerskovia turbata]RXR35177.1 S1 family peptidase [Oerskovia turbata]TGJ96420.1 serine protease [Actinotalea fermentans ATCC 43279 = JCM 9966 = DSM 3133]
MARSFWRTLATACAATALVAGPAALTANAATPTPDTPTVSPQTSSKVSPEVLRALQRDLGLSAKDATKRLAFQSDAASTEDALADSLDAYAGAWVDPARNTLYVGVADRAEAKEVRSAGATPVVVDHTLAELDTWKAALDGELNDPAGVPSWFVDVTTNQVVVNVHDGGRALAELAAASAGVPADAITYVTTTEAPRPLVDVVGGNAYTMGSGGRCSVGFAVNGGFITAGHCGSVGTRTSGPGGTFRGSNFPGNDYAWVQVDAGNTPVGAVNNYSGGRVAVAGSTAAPVGASVCRSGSTTGWHCGTIGAYNTSVTYPQGTVSGLIRTNVCAEPGDSGGSLLAGNQAQGVTSGGSGNCSSGGTTYFQPVNEALGVYGLTLVTSDGGGTEPPPTGCQGYARTYQGSVSAGTSVAQPNGSYVTTGGGTHRVCLSGPAGTDLDLYLQKWNGYSWASVAQSTSPGATEAVTYTGTAGYYRYVVHAYAGSGAYTLGATTP